MAGTDLVHQIICCRVSARRLSFNWDDDGLLAAKTMGISSPSLSLLNEYHCPYLLLLVNGNDGIKQHFFCSIEEAYYLVVEVLFVSIFPRLLSYHDEPDGRTDVGNETARACGAKTIPTQEGRHHGKIEATIKNIAIWSSFFGAARAKRRRR